MTLRRERCTTFAGSGWGRLRLGFPAVAAFLLVGLLVGRATDVLAQPVDLDPDAAVGTAIEEAETPPEVPAAELADELDDVTSDPQTPAVDQGSPVQDATVVPPETGAQRQAATSRRERVTVRRAPPPPTHIVITEVRTTPSAYLEAERVAAVAAELTGRRVALDALNEITSAFNQLYADQGIALAQAVITALDVRAGTVDVELFEARLGAVRPNGRLASEDYYKRRIGVRAGDLADNRIIQANLQRFSVTDGIRADASFVPGTERGLTDLVVDFAEPQKLTFTATADTFGTPSTGEYRLRLGLTDASLTGVLDPLNLSVTVTEGLLGGAISYARPINALGSRIFGSVDVERSRTLGPIEVIAHSVNAEAGINHAFVTEPQLRVLGRASTIGFFDESKLAGVAINDQIGAGIQAGVTLAHERPGLRFSYDQSARFVVWDDRVFALSGLETGYLIGNATLVVSPVAAVALSVRGGWQIAIGDRAPGAYRTTIASPEIVRGYETGLSAGDSFYWVRAQVDTPIPVPDMPDWTVVPFAFFDHGRAYDQIAGNAVAQDGLSSLGAGVAVLNRRWGSAEVFVSKPLVDANGFDADDAVRVDGRVSARF